MIGTILGVAGSVVSAAQAIDQNRKKKAAEASAKALANEAKNAKLQNAYAGLRVSDAGERLAAEYGQASDISALEALKSAGPEAALGGASAVANEANRRNLEIGASLSDKEAQRDQLVAAGQQEVNAANFENQQDILSNQIFGAQTAAADAQASRNAAINSAVSGIGGVVSGLGDNENLDYKTKRNRRKAKNVGTSALSAFQSVNPFKS